jgi:hypothetical protein
VVPGSSNKCGPYNDMYLHNTDEAHIVHYVWFKPNGGLHGLEMKFLNKNWAYFPSYILKSVS